MDLCNGSKHFRLVFLLLALNVEHRGGKKQKIVSVVHPTDLGGSVFKCSINAF